MHFIFVSVIVDERVKFYRTTSTIDKKWILNSLIHVDYHPLKPIFLDWLNLTTFSTEMHSFSLMTIVCGSFNRREQSVQYISFKPHMVTWLQVHWMFSERQKANTHFFSFWFIFKREEDIHSGLSSMGVLQQLVKLVELQFFLGISAEGGVLTELK